MTVIQEGDLSRLDGIKRFTCHRCGCIFEADKTEYELNDQFILPYYACTCPTCEHKVYIAQYKI